MRNWPRRATGEFLSGPAIGASRSGGIVRLRTSFHSAGRVLRLGEHFGSKQLDAHLGIAPGAEREPGLPAGFLEEALRTPALLRRYLGKEQPAEGAQGNNHSMPPRVQAIENFHDGYDFGRREDGNFDLQRVDFMKADGWKSRVARSRENGAKGHRRLQRFRGVGPAHASPQAAGQVQSHEGTAALPLL